MIVSLLTDFGSADTYVGQMKGAILAVAPTAALVDLTHGVPPQDEFDGAFQLWTAVDPFPAGSVHLAVVDPGVGSSRRAVAVRCARGDVFVGPDNGLLLPAIERLGGSVLAIELTERRFWRTETPAATFHGRDLFGPVAGHIVNGVPLQQLGHAIEQLRRPFSLSLADGLEGIVLHVDAYGNLITNVPAHRLPPRFVVRLGELRIESAMHYAAVAGLAPLALVGSAGLLEISLRNGNAAQHTGASRGTRVQVEASG